MNIWEQYCAFCWTECCELYSSTLSLTSALYGVCNLRHASAALPPGKKAITQCTGGWVGPRGAEILAPPGFFFSYPGCSFDPFCTFKSFRPSSCHLCSILLSLYNKYNTNIHALGGIRTHNPSKRAAADLRLRPRGHWDWPLTVQSVFSRYTD